ncbi:hypothetical protein RJ639_015040 [Escallonia herrerae]|uniref:Integrase zinc-binding domain-containing protein n=1 Tax=Escallonia herrerae TaxID=1293975 RepID=A0AA89AMP8_9ASTE|nr:hypothetical protein RJ639_015040 [Escallonia herrerae]
MEEHLEHLRKVLTQLREHELYVKLSKCTFALTKIKFLGHVIEQDNTTVSHFLSQLKLTSKQARWQELLAEFNLMLEYRAGSTNSIADALNRRAELDQLALIAMNAIVRADSRVAINIGKKIKKALTKDSVAQQLLKLVESDKTQLFCQEDGLLMTNGRRVHLPRVDDLRRTLIRECHDIFWAGYAGGERMLVLIQQGYYWPQMGDDMQEYVKICLTCQRDKV